MAMLTRPYTIPHRVSEFALTSSIPKPFPSHAERERLLRVEHLKKESTEETHVNIDAVAQDGPSQIGESSSVAQGSKISGDVLVSAILNEKKTDNSYSASMNSYPR